MVTVTSEPIKIFRAGDPKQAELDAKLSLSKLWSCPPTQLTMYLDEPETFQVMQGAVAVGPVTLQGKPLGEMLEVQAGEYGVVPAGAYRWEVLRPTTKLTDCCEGLQLTTKGWQAEGPFLDLRGKGTLGTIGRTAKDDLEFLRGLVAQQGGPPPSSWESAVQYKLDKDPYLAKLAFAVTDKGILVQDRVTEQTLEVLTERGLEAWDPQGTYQETEGSVRWRLDGSFDRNPMFRRD